MRRRLAHALCECFHSLADRHDKCPVNRRTIDPFAIRVLHLQAAGLVLPHNARAISMFGKKIAISELQPGDLVFYNTMRHTYSHVGIYLGENKFVHASVTGRGVEVVNMNENYWVKRFNGARRVVTSRLPFAASNE